MTPVKATDNGDLLRWPPAQSVHNAAGHHEVFYARCFGTSRADLDIDFAQPQRPVLISRLLQACLQQGSGESYIIDEIWHWSLPQRLQALLAIVVATRGQYMRLAMRCVQPECKESMELDIDLLDFCDTRQVESFLCRPAADTAVELRLPTGNDQLDWLDRKHDKADEWFSEMVTTLVVNVNGKPPADDWQVPTKWLPSMAASLEQHDSLATLQLSTSCPVCQQDMQVEFDLEDHLLAELAAKQELLLNQIHRLASGYHWTESDILSLSARRRDYYLECLNKRRFS